MVAFEQLYRAHAPAVMARIIRPRLREQADREDVLVETFRTALEKLHTFRWMGRGLFSWLARIAVNKSTDLMRSRSARGRAIDRFQAEPVTEEAPRPDLMVLANAERSRLGARVHEVLGDINPRYAKALRLRFLDGLERPECAEALEVKIGTFDVVLLRSVRAFRKAWVARYGEEELA